MTPRESVQRPAAAAPSALHPARRGMPDAALWPARPTAAQATDAQATDAPTLSLAAGAVGDEGAAALRDADIRLTGPGFECVYGSHHLPIVLGRSPRASLRVDHPRTSRFHARLEWRDGAFRLVDLSSNGTIVQFAQYDECVDLRPSTPGAAPAARHLHHDSCSLQRSGTILLGGSVADPASPRVSFEILPFLDTVRDPVQV